MDIGFHIYIDDHSQNKFSLNRPGGTWNVGEAWKHEKFWKYLELIAAGS